MPPSIPLVLCISGHDPTGGAGIQADIETCAALGTHALGVIAAHTVQDTHDVSRISALAPILLAAQLDALLDDCRPAAVKLGLLGDSQQIPVIVRRLSALDVPVVMDPVLSAGGGKNLVAARLQAAIIEELLPRVDVLTPNAAEARRLAGLQDLKSCGPALLTMGVKNVIITGGDEPGKNVVNTWYRSQGKPQRFAWPRLPETFHGAGCTLASALAALLAAGTALAEAIEGAQCYTHETLQRALTVGEGRRIPGRIPGKWQ
jgi:hydroxymethylpyrimidine/phosphomethylpyrimidine kinase